MWTIETKERLLSGTVLLGLCLAAAPARAELAYFANGRHLSIESHRIENGSLVLVLRAGGEIVCDPSAIARIAPDEVPYPAPVGVAPEPVRVAGPADGDGRYEELISRAAAAHGVDPRLVRAVIEAESAYNERARSPKGAMGLMQLMPATARQYAVADPYDPQANIDAGTRYLRAMLERFPVAEALAAYNAGPSAVERFGGVPPYAETRTYVSRVLRLAQFSAR